MIVHDQGHAVINVSTDLYIQENTTKSIVHTRLQ